MSFPPSRWPLIAAIGVICLLLLVLLRNPLVVVALGILIAVALYMAFHAPSLSEAESLRTSILLSAEDISDVLNEYDDFLTGLTTDHIADRQLTRPALADRDCTDPEIEEFFFTMHSASRFLHRLEARLAGEVSISQLEALLAVTDRRALEVREAWVCARRTAARLGTDYSTTDPLARRREIDGPDDDATPQS